jgi:hypothetical protein
MTRLLPAVLVLAACADAGMAPDGQADSRLNLDKELIQADELAAAVAARTLLDMAAEPALFQLGMEQAPATAVSPMQACMGEPQVVWQETGCAGLHGWGVSLDIAECPVASDQGVVGSVFWSTPEILASVPPDAPPEDAASQVFAILAGLGPNRVVRYQTALQGEHGGSLTACGTSSGDLEHRYASEVAEGVVGDHQMSLVWTAEVSRVGAESPTPRDVAQGTLLVQVPAGALVDPDRLSVAGFARHVSLARPDGGELVQRGWEGDVYATIDPETVSDATIEVEAATGSDPVVLPRF